MFSGGNQLWGRLRRARTRGEKAKKGGGGEERVNTIVSLVVLLLEDGVGIE